MEYLSVLFFLLLASRAPNVLFRFMHHLRISLCPNSYNLWKSVHTFVCGPSQTRPLKFSSDGAKRLYTASILRYREECFAGKFGRICVVCRVLSKLLLNRMSIFLAPFRARVPHSRIFNDYEVKFETGYEMGPELGSGGFASVFLCTQRDTRAKYACKVLEKCDEVILPLFPAVLIPVFRLQRCPPFCFASSLVFFSLSSSVSNPMLDLDLDVDPMSARFPLLSFSVRACKASCPVHLERGDRDAGDGRVRARCLLGGRVRKPHPRVLSHGALSRWLSASQHPTTQLAGRRGGQNHLQASGERSAPVPCPGRLPHGHQKR